MRAIRLRRRLMAALTPAVLFTAPALLQPETGWSQQIEEVTVTARRREENAQDIPVAVASFDSDFIDKQGVVSTADVVKLVPGVQFDQGFSAADTRISIRGINNTRGRASVATLIDGIDISGENVTAGGGGSLLNTRLVDLERVEVIKGPQSALYGRNAFAGAINYVTRKPDLEEFRFEASGDVAEYDSYRAKAAVSVPIVPNVFALRFNAAYLQSDGYFNNNTIDNAIDPGNTQDLNGYENKGARLAGLWQVSDDLSIEAAVTYEENESDPRAVAKVANANTFYDADGNVLQGVTVPEFSAFSNQAYGQWLGTVKSVSESMVTLSNTGPGGQFAGSEDKRWFANLQLNWDIGSVTFRSLTSYLDNDASLSEDVDYQNGFGTIFSGVGLSVANDYVDQTDTTQFTQDFILQSNDWDRGTWLVGAQYYTESVDNSDFSLGWYNDPNTAFALPCGPGPFLIACSYSDSLAKGSPTKDISRDTDSYSLYGLVSYDFTDRLTGSVEVRYVSDEIEVTTNSAIDRVSQYLLGFPIDLAGVAPQPVALPTSDKQKTDEINPRFTLDYKLTDAAMVFGSVARGTKPGGFGTSQMSVPQIARNEPETLWAYELGAKTAWFDQTVIANASVFFYQYEDRQIGVTVTDPVSGFPAAGIVNAGEAETQGFELELLWSATENLELGLGYAYTDAEWTDFNYSKIRANGPTSKDKAICGNVNGDCSGAQIAGIPEHALTLLGSWARPIGSGGLELFVNGNARYQSERTLEDSINTAEVDASWRVDGQIGLQTEQWSVMVFATNLLDDDTVLWGQFYNDFKDGMYGGAFGGEPRDESIMAYLPDPRIVGLRASYNFGN